MSAACQKLKEKWAAGPRMNLGLATAGFPNLWMITAPGSRSVLSNMMVSIEQHVEWIADAMSWLQDHKKSTLEATIEAEDEWTAHVDEVGRMTLPGSEQLVHGRQRRGQSSRVHALRRRGRRLS